MSVLLMSAISLAVAIGVLLLLARDRFRVIVGLMILGSAANLVVFMTSRPGSLIAPVIAAGSNMLPSDAANPLPQALVLTAIVIGFALLCFALILGAALAGQQDADDPDALRASEPPPTDPIKPPELPDS